MKVALSLIGCSIFRGPGSSLLAYSHGRPRKGETMALPSPRYGGGITVEEAIRSRRTVRSYAPTPISLEQLSQLLFAAQGITEEGGFKRAAPSGGALYPIDIYSVVGKGGVKGLDSAIYHYIPETHNLKKVASGDRRELIAGAALYQMWMAEAPVNFVVTAEYSRICVKYGNRGVRYAMIEAGHVGQNIFLQAEALGLRAGIVGAFEDRKVIKVMEIPSTHQPLLIMPVGFQG